MIIVFFFSSRRRHTRSYGDWSSDVCSSDLVWPGNVPEDRHSGVGPRVLDHSRKQREVIILREEYRRFGALHFFQNDIRKPPVDSLILHPVLRTKDGTRMRNVRERPQSFIRKTLVVALVFFVGEPHAPQGITRMIGRNTQMIANIHHFAVSVA